LLRSGWSAARYTERCKETGIKIHPARSRAALPEFFINC
jgi:hypothetical protein